MKLPNGLMKFIQIGLFSLAVVSVAMANCSLIHDLNKRYLCLAEVQHNSARCHLIRDLDIQRYCLARIQSHITDCYLIKDRDLRNYCRAAVNAKNKFVRGIDNAKR